MNEINDSHSRCMQYRSDYSPDGVTSGEANTKVHQRLVAVQGAYFSLARSFFVIFHIPVHSVKLVYSSCQGRTSSDVNVTSSSSHSESC